jgi:DNA-3-methyladenine glycosylase I
LDVGFGEWIMARCGWVNEADEVYCDYHDTEWGVPIRDDRALWELLCLESFQAGLSWITILRKRDAFRLAFAGFEPAIVAKFGEADITRLLTDAGIVRSRLKIESVIRAAQIFEEMKATGESFSDFIWGGRDIAPVQNAWVSYRDAPVSNPASEALSKRLKAKGFKFCGPVICLAFMQATGMINDHEVGCPRHAPVRAMG